MDDGRYRKYSDYLKDTYHEKVYKIPVNLPVSCPVRDGTLSQEGCIYCGENATGYEMCDASVKLETQISSNVEYIAKKYGASAFEIYFQNFTNTYLPPMQFETYARRALCCGRKIGGVKILTVSTRPDCIAREYLDILRSLSEEFGVDINIELGLQSVNARTLRLLQRGHGLAEYIQSVLLIREYGFGICTHLIVTLPWDNDDDIIEAAKIVSVLKTQSVKLHTLYIEKGTILERMYRQGEVNLLPIETYVKRTADFLEYLDPQISVQRLNARVPSDVSVFANWGRSHWVLTDMVLEEMQKRGTRQGSRCGYGADAQVKQFLVGEKNGD
jgi:radical SAM protein (TIGR01212 family)